MTRLSDIPVRIESAKPQENHLAMARQVLLEVQAALVTWLNTGEEAAIDLRHQPRMGPATYQYLREALGSGEVTIVIEAKARIDIRETRYPGVWWVTHNNDRGDTVTEIIEITAIPAILKPHAAEIREGLHRLEQALAEPGSEGSSVPLN